jgi:hypothetical protein
VEGRFSWKGLADQLLDLLKEIDIQDRSTEGMK